MDLSLMVGDEYKLNIRAAGMIIHNNKILLHRNKQEEHYCIIGGRIEIGEDSKTTVKREMEEERSKIPCALTMEDIRKIVREEIREDRRKLYERELRNQTVI